MVDGNGIKHWDTSSQSYIRVSKLPLIANKFQSYGDDNYHKERTGLVPTSPIFKIWSPLAEMPVPVVTQIIGLKSVIVSMKEDILFSESYIIVPVLQGITEAQWMPLGLSGKKIKFAWYM
ncbi:hypothetical protein [Clostridium kluyveri]|uniref:hypothetical protein n=1 Tax=Clostridium kluyveri TaxID=1534 RepID=UPI002245B9BC|nr:hypothetical protein [Clostridium kluyveri]UZQ50010.1 hypothetical protein OP486_19000 [Clostridium kluyveri]